MQQTHPDVELPAQAPDPGPGAHLRGFVGSSGRAMSTWLTAPALLGPRGWRILTMAISVLALLLRAHAALTGWFRLDDYGITATADRVGLTGDLLLTPLRGFPAPLPWSVAAVLTEASGWQYLAYALVLVELFALLIAWTARLGSRLWGWGPVTAMVTALVGLSPVLVQLSAWWYIGICLVPMLLAIVGGIDLVLGWIERRGAWRLVALAMLVALALASTPRAMLVIPLLAGVAWVRVRAVGDPDLTLLSGMRRVRGLLGLLLVLSAAYAVLVVVVGSGGQARLGWPSARMPLDAAVHMLGVVLAPGIAGGPWSWGPAGPFGADTGSLTPGALGYVILTLSLLATVVAWRRSGPAGRGALVVLCGYLLADVALFAVTSWNAPELATVPRFVADAIPVVAILGGIAVREPEGWSGRRAPHPTRGRDLVALALVNCLVVSAVAGAVAHEGQLRVLDSRDWTLRALASLDLQAQPLLLDRRMPPWVFGSFDPSDSLMSVILGRGHAGAFVDSTSDLRTLDASGALVPASVTGAASMPGPADCGWPVRAGQSVWIPLRAPVTTRDPVLLLEVTVGGEGSARVDLGSAVATPIDLTRGSSTVLARVRDVLPGADVPAGRVRVASDVALCVRSLTLGDLEPQYR